MDSITKGQVALALLEFLDREIPSFDDEEAGFYFTEGATMFAADLVALAESLQGKVGDKA